MRYLKLLIAIPSNTGRSMYSVPFVHSLIKLCHKIPQEVDFDLKYFSGLSIDVVRLQMAQYAIRENFDIIVMLDDDMSFPEDTITKFIEHYDDGKKIVGGIYQSKGYPFHFFLNRANTQFGNWDLAYEEGVHKVKMFGTGCLMISTDVFSQIAMPYFLLRKDVHGNLTGTEDCFFAMNCYLNGVAAYIDTSILCQHIKTVTFPEFFTHPKIAYDGKINKHEFPAHKHIGSIWEKDKELDKNFGKLAVSPLELSYWRDGIDKCAHTRQMELPINKEEPKKYKCLDCGLISEGIDAMKLLQRKVAEVCTHSLIKHGRCMYCGISEAECFES